MFSCDKTDSYIRVDSKLVAASAKETMNSIEKDREDWIRKSIKTCRNWHWRRSFLFRKKITIEQARKESGVSDISFYCGKQYETCKFIYKVASKYDGDMTLSIKDAITINLKLGE